MSKILFFKPFDYYYFSSTVRNYVNLIENMENVEVVDCSNFRHVKIENNPLIIFLPFTLFGINKKQFINKKV